MALFRKKTAAKSKPVAGAGAGGKDTTYLGRKLKVKGTVSGDGNVIILGQLEGKFDLKGELTIAEPANVSGEIRAGLISVKGLADGMVIARDKLHLEPSAKVSGKVYAKTVSMLEGAQMDGEMAMSSSPGRPAKKGASS
jgi:cytoskeletal protein CcmA (bactofilin family)